MNKENKIIYENLPWAISIEEFKQSGNFETWSPEAINMAIRTLVELTIIAYQLQPKDRNN